MVADPWGTPSVPDMAYDYDALKTKQELDAIWGLVEHLLSEARSCHEYGRDENAWSEKVVLPLMQAAVERGEQTVFEVDNMYAVNVTSLEVSC